MFFASDRWTDKWLFLQVRCDVTPFFPSPVLLRSLSSVFPCPQPLSDLLSDVFDGQWYSLCSSVPSALLQPVMKKSSLHDNFPHHIAVLCLSTTCWSSFAAWPGLVPTTFLLPSPHTRVWLYISSQRPSCLVSEDHAHVHRHLQRVPLRPPDAEIPSLDITLPASPLVCINLCSSKISIVHAFHCSLLHLFIHTRSAQKTVATTDKPCVWLWKVHQARQRGVSTQKSVREKISQDVQVVEVVSVALTKGKSPKMTWWNDVDNTASKHKSAEGVRFASKCAWKATALKVCAGVGICVHPPFEMSFFDW